MKSADLYIIPVCNYCDIARALLKKYRIEYREFDVSKDKEARERMIELSHQKGVPVVDFGDEVFVGFNRAELERALQ